MRPDEFRSSVDSYRDFMNTDWNSPDGIRKANQAAKKVGFNPPKKDILLGGIYQDHESGKYLCITRGHDSLEKVTKGLEDFFDQLKDPTFNQTYPGAAQTIAKLELQSPDEYRTTNAVKLIKGLESNDANTIKLYQSLEKVIK